MANNNDSGRDLHLMLKSLPMADVALHDMPSVLVSQVDDWRIDKYAKTHSGAFIVRSEGATKEFVLIVDPARWTGYLWWKKALRVELSPERYQKLLEGADFRDEEKIFLQNLKP